MAISEWINYLDILSFKPELKINGNSRFITNLGKSVSVICLVSIIILSSMTVFDVFSRKIYTIIYNLDNREIPRININESQIALALVDPLGKEINDFDRYFNFMVKFWKIEVNLNFNENTTNYQQTYIPKNTILDMPLKNCSSLNYSKFSDFYQTFSKTYASGVCIDFSNFNQSLFGKYGGIEGYSTLNIYIKKCVNSTAQNKTNCYPDSVIDQKLSQAFLIFVSIENDIDSNDYQNPILEYTKNDMLPLSTTIFKNYFKDINKVKFTSDNGFIFGFTNNFETYRTDKIIESVDLRGKNTLFPGTFNQITLRCSGKTEIYFRTYLKLQASFAYIGGILQAVILIGQCFVFIYSQNSMFYYLFSHLFNYEEIKNLLKNDKINSNLSISQLANFKPLEKSSEFLNRDKHIKLNLQGIHFKTINYNSNSNLAGKDNTYIHNEMSAKAKKIKKLINENDNFNNNNMDLNVQRKDFINKKNSSEDGISEEKFKSKVKIIKNQSKKSHSGKAPNSKHGNILEMKNNKNYNNNIDLTDKYNLNSSNQMPNKDNSDLNNLNEINNIKENQ